MASQFKTAASLFPIAILIVAFQNCSAPKFSATDTSSAKALTTPETLGALPGSDGTGGSDPTVGTGGSAPIVGTMPGTIPGTTTRTPAGTEHDSDHGQGPADVDPKSNDTEHASSGSDDDKTYRDACSELLKSKKSVSLAAGMNIENHSGVMRYVASGFSSVEHNSGALALACNEKGGLVKSLNSNSGMTLICGCDVDEIKSHSGKVIVVDGNVGQVSDSSGLVMVGGKIGALSNNSGKVVGY